MSGTVYRRAHGGDAPLLAALHARCFEKSWDARSFARLLARRGALALLAAQAESHRPAGFVLFERVAGEAEILTMGIHPDYRRRGIASGLLAHGCGELVRLGVGRLYLEVAEDNVAALALYRSAGFAGKGRRRSYYRRGAGGDVADALVLTRKLVPPGRR